jgi:hypothetical protein
VTAARSAAISSGFVEVGSSSENRRRIFAAPRVPGTRQAGQAQGELPCAFGT